MDDKRKVLRVWDIPETIFRELSDFFGISKELEEYIFPQELRIWRELKIRRNINAKTLLCLRIFPKKNNGKMQRILYVWTDKDIQSWKNPTKDFRNFSKGSIFSINGYVKKSTIEEIDTVSVKFFNDYRYLSPGLIDLFSRIMLSYGQVLVDPRLRRDTKKIIRRLT